MTGIINKIGTGAARIGHKLLFKAKKASPEILLIGGIGCIIGGTVMACKAAKKTDKIVENYDYEVERVRENMEEDGCEEREIKKEVGKIKVKKYAKLARNYALPATVIGTGIGMVCGGHGILRKENGKLLLTAGAFEQMLRARPQLCSAKSDEELYRDPEWLKEDENSDKLMSMARGHYYDSPYVFDMNVNTSEIFDTRNMDINLNNIRCAEDNLNIKLRLRDKNDPVMLAEALREVGINPGDYPWATLCCWFNNGDGDNGIKIYAIPNHEKKNILLEFNCDGFYTDKL